MKPARERSFDREVVPVLATCVKMQFSLARYRHERPAPPFVLGGEFLRLEGRCFLRDAVFTLEILPATVCSELSDGDQVLLSVEAITADSIHAREAQVDGRSTRAQARPPRPHALPFAQFVRTIRDFLIARGLSEVFTPTLVKCPGLEPSLEPFSVETLFNSEKSTAYLPTSPEIHLKKAMALGYTDIFEIKACFRKGEFSAHHENEFTMLEWYRGFADLEMILMDLKALLVAVGCGREVRVTTFQTLFRDLLGFALMPQTTRAELSECLTRLDSHHTASDSFNDLFHRLLIEKIEPAMREMGPLVVRDFPPSMAALAKLTSTGWADRFEFYWSGLEIANAFFEVTDPREQERRWLAEQEERRHLRTTPLPQDPGLIAALECGIPASGGIALGIERLYMALHGVRDIRELKLFSTDDLFT